MNNKEDRWSEHGLGHLLNPTDPEADDREWIAQAWRNIIRRSHGLSTESPSFESLPAVGRFSASSPAVMKALAGFNNGKPYRDQIKPFNFLLACQPKPFGHPTGTDPERFHLIAPYTSDPKQWLKMSWLDQYSGTSYRIMTGGQHGTRQSARVKTYGDVLREYELHPEAKCADAQGNTCQRGTVGLLQRRCVRIEHIRYIGKESNLLDDVQSGGVQSPAAVYTEYVDQRRDEWQTLVLPTLKRMPLSELMHRTGMSRRALMDLRAGRSRPHRTNRERLTAVAKESIACE